MKNSRVLIFILTITLLSIGSVVVNQTLNISLTEKELQRKEFHPLNYLEAPYIEEAKLLRKAKDFLYYYRPEEAIKELSGKWRELPCWKKYFLGIAMIKTGRPQGYRVLLSIPKKCASRKSALEYLVENCDDLSVLENIPLRELSNDKRLKLRWRLGEKGIDRRIYCEHPLLAMNLGIRINRVSSECHRKRYNIFFRKGKFSYALKEAKFLDRFSLARCYFYLRRYSRVISFLRRPGNSRELYLKFRAYIRAKRIFRAKALKGRLYKAGLAQEYLWQMSMFYYPDERGFKFMEEYLRRYPEGKFSEIVKKYIKLRELCLAGKPFDEKREEEFITVKFPHPSPYEEFHIRKAALLRSAFLYREAIEEIEFLRRKNDSPLLMYLEGVLKAYSGDYLSSLRLIRKALGGAPLEDERTLELLYPFPLKDRIVELARRNDIDPFLLAALIHQESLFNPEAVSSAGAIGLMQLMKGTFKSTAIRMGANFSNPYDPEENLKVGVRHFSELLNYYKGKVPLALAAYNAGIKNVDRWRSFLPCEDVNTFIELIPIPQTRKYVKMIMRKWRMYRRLYDKSRVDLRR